MKKLAFFKAKDQLSGEEVMKLFYIPTMFEYQTQTQQQQNTITVASRIQNTDDMGNIRVEEQYLQFNTMADVTNYLTQEATTWKTNYATWSYVETKMFT